MDLSTLVEMIATKSGPNPPGEVTAKDKVSMAPALKPITPTRVGKILNSAA